jgi:hypothetical protein
VKRFPNVDAARPGYLTVEESQRLIAAASASFRPLVHAGLLTGCRYGELIALTCGDYQRGKIYVAQPKSGKPRSVTLSDEGVIFFDSMVSGRASSDPMFLRHDDKPWRGSQQTEPMQDACGRAGIVPAIGFHQLRHTWASLAIMNGMPLKLVARNLGHANTLMVEKHYGHLTESYIRRLSRRLDQQTVGQGSRRVHEAQGRGREARRRDQDARGSRRFPHQGQSRQAQGLTGASQRPRETDASDRSESHTEGQQALAGLYQNVESNLELANYAETWEWKEVKATKEG